MYHRSLKFIGGEDSSSSSDSSVSPDSSQTDSIAASGIADSSVVVTSNHAFGDSSDEQPQLAAAMPANQSPGM